MSIYGSKIAGAILAGGRNSRFPFLKGFIRLGGIPIIERNLNLMQRFFDVLLISANDPKPYQCFGVPVVPDSIDSRGPLSGIYSCLEHSHCPCIFVVACDMPFIEELLIKRICDYYLALSETKQVKALTPVYKGFVQPLFGIYSTDAMEDIKKAVLLEKVMMVKFLEEINTHYLDIESIIDEGLLSVNPFVNINTVKDYDELLMAGYDVSINIGKD